MWHVNLAGHCRGSVGERLEVASDEVGTRADTGLRMSAVSYFPAMVLDTALSATGMLSRQDDDIHWRLDGWTRSEGVKSNVGTDCGEAQQWFEKT